MSRELGSFVVCDSSKCTGCRACELACFTVHNQKKNNVGKTVGTVKIPVTPKLYVTYFEEGSMPVQCKHCEDAPCLNVCTKGAIKRIDHQIVVLEDLCIGCKDCMQACPFGAVALLPYAKNGEVLMQEAEEQPVKTASKCDLCMGMEDGPACVRVCPHEALRLVHPEEERLLKNEKAAQALYLTRNWQ